MKRKIISLFIVPMALVCMGCPNPATPDPDPISADYTSPNIGTLKYVPAGTFSRDGVAGHDSTVSAFRMSQYEITRAQFAAIMVTDPSNTTFSSGTSDPVQQANWYHAIAFCNKLSLDEGLTPVYSVSGVNFNTLTYAQIPTTSNTDWNAATATWSNNGYRLPTEMEWMWAAMGAPPDGQGGETNTTGYLKAFSGSDGSNAIGDYAWYVTNSSDKTHPAGAKAANELGLYDMSGNVWEWTWDWDGDYPTEAVTDYRGAVPDLYRVIRGGGYGNLESSCTVADRGNSPPYFRVSVAGFRVVRPCVLIKV